MPGESILIIGGGPAGLEAARGVADLGYKAILVEKRGQLGGTPISANYAALTHGMRDASEVMAEMVAAVRGNPLVDVRLNATVTGSSGAAGGFRGTLQQNGGPA